MGLTALRVRPALTLIPTNIILTLMNNTQSVCIKRRETNWYKEHFVVLLAKPMLHIFASRKAMFVGKSCVLFNRKCA